MKRTTRNHEKKKNKVKQIITKELQLHTFRAEGFSYLISIITSIQKEFEFNSAGYEVAKKIQEAIQNQMSQDIVYEVDELRHLTELLVAPLEQQVMFDFKADFNEVTHPQNFFCDELWKRLLDRSQFDDYYVARLKEILRAGLSIDVKLRYKRAFLKKNLVKNYIYCPYFITTFVLRWFVFKPTAGKHDFISYSNVVQTFSTEKQIVFILYYILLKMVLDIDKYVDDNGELRKFRENHIFNILQKYVLDTKLNDMEEEESLSVPKAFFSTIDSIIKNIDKHSEECADFFDLIDVSDIESIANIDSNKCWDDKKAVVKNILMRS